MSGAKSPQAGLTRRSFLKTTAAVAGATAAVGGAGALTALAADDGGSSAEVTYANCVCRSNCNFSCRYTGHVRDGKLMKLEVADYLDDGYTGSCLKGLSYINRIYNPQRVQYPMRRVDGTERGAGQWERITWDEAVEEIAKKLHSAIDEFGPQSVVLDLASGAWGLLGGPYGIWRRLFYCFGGNILACSYDYAAGHGINRVLGTGDWFYCNEPNSALNASMIVVWGTNPVFTHPQNWRWVMWAKEQGTKVICIDPIKSATAHKSTEYIPVIPGHDGYLALAMCQHIIENDLQDWAFLSERSTAAFLVRKDTGKLLRKSDYADPEATAEPDGFYVWDKATNGVALVGEAVDPAFEGTFTAPDDVEVTTSYSLLKAELAQYTVEKASELTGIPEDRIRRLAEEFASEEAVSIFVTYGCDHWVNGYQNTWAMAILQTLTGNLAKDGAGFLGVWNQNYSPNYAALWIPPDFVLAYSQLPETMLAETFETQKLEGRDYPLKAMISAVSNPLSNYSSQNDFLTKILPNLDFWVVVDIEMTDSARYADMVLPCCSWYETEDVRLVYDAPYTTYQEKAIEQMYESKPDWEIVCLIGRAMGFTKAFPEEYGFDDYMNLLLSNEQSKTLGITLENLRKNIVVHTSGKPGDSMVRGKTIPFPTESSRAQLYTENPVPRLNWGQDLSDGYDREHIVYYQPPHEARRDHELYQKYPLVFLQEHSRFRVHTQWFEVGLLRELDPEPLAKVSRADAEARGVVSGDIVEVFNDRGHAVLKCMVDDSISAGVLSIPKGWQRHQFIDGCFQEMTCATASKWSAAFSYYDSLVDFRKWEG